MKNSKFSVKLSDLKITEERKKKISGMLLRNMRLFFLIFLGAVSVYFSVIFKKAFSEISDVQYPAYKNVFADSAGKTTLEKATQNIEDRRKNLESLKGKHYIDPFSFRDDDVTSPKQTSAAEKKGEVAGTSGDAGAGNKVVSPSAP